MEAFTILIGEGDIMHLLVSRFGYFYYCDLCSLYIFFSFITTLSPPLVGPPCIVWMIRWLGLSSFHVRKLFILLLFSIVLHQFCLYMHKFLQISFFELMLLSPISDIGSQLWDVHNHMIGTVHRATLHFGVRVHLFRVTH